MKSLIIITLGLFVFQQSTYSQKEPINLPSLQEQTKTYRSMGIEIAFSERLYSPETNCKDIDSVICELYDQYQTTTRIFPLPPYKHLMPAIKKIFGIPKNEKAELILEAVYNFDGNLSLYLSSKKNRDVLYGWIMLTYENAYYMDHDKQNHSIVNGPIEKYHQKIKKYLRPIVRPPIVLNDITKPGLEGWLIIPPYTLDNFYKVAIYLEDSKAITTPYSSPDDRELNFHYTEPLIEPLGLGFVYLYDSSIVGPANGFSRMLEAQDFLKFNPHNEEFELYEIMCLIAITKTRVYTDFDIFKPRLLKKPLLIPRFQPKKILSTR